VLLHGARQTGKTTLARAITTRGHPARYLTFDDAVVDAAARADPAGFVSGLEGPVILDEVQRVPEIFRAIKAAVDRDRRPGRFLLTGSANVMVVPRASESLAGRMEILTLWPLSQDEIASSEDHLLDVLVGEHLPAQPPPKRSRRNLVERLLTGGFPEVVSNIAPARRSEWFGSYLTAILQRDVRDLANVADLSSFPRLLALVASRPMGLLNNADLSRTTGLPQTTVKRYLALLEATFLVRSLPPWYVKIGKRLVKSPKVFLTDAGLAAHLLGLDAARLLNEPRLLGGLLELFVVMELQKQAGWSKARPRFHHFRSHDGYEVDLVLDIPAGPVVGVEIKATETVTASDLRGLRLLAQATGDRFHRGIVLYGGADVVPFAPNLHAVPVNAVWEWGLDSTQLRCG
jgi:hypothetical protein